MRLRDFLNENKTIWEKMSLEQIIDFFSNIKITQKPKNVSKTDNDILKIIKQLSSSIQELQKTGSDYETELIKLKGKLRQLRLSKEDIESYYAKSTKDEIKTKNARYVKQGYISNKKFENAAENIDSFLSELKNYHKKITKNLTIRFVDGRTQKSIAKYKENEDVLQININKTGNTKEEYGSLRYVILHELGHRYLKAFPQKWNHDDTKWITTKYSGVDSLTGEEKFAELFAISHWKNKYSQYKDKIEKFEKRIN